MVKSSTVSISPAQHASRHSVGAADPLVAPLLDSYPYVLGSTVLHTNNSEVLYTTGTYAKKKEIKVTAHAATIRIRFSGAKNTAGNGIFRIYINGVAVGTERTVANGAGWVVYNEDLAVLTGDLIQLYGKSSDGNNAKAQNFQILGGGSLPPTYVNQMI